MQYIVRYSWTVPRQIERATSEHRDMSCAYENSLGSSMILDSEIDSELLGTESNKPTVDREDHQQAGIRIIVMPPVVTLHRFCTLYELISACKKVTDVLISLHKKGLVHGSVTCSSILLEEEEDRDERKSGPEQLDTDVARIRQRRCRKALLSDYDHDSITLNLNVSSVPYVAIRHLLSPDHCHTISDDLESLFCVLVMRSIYFEGHSHELNWPGWEPGCSPSYYSSRTSRLDKLGLRRLQLLVGFSLLLDGMSPYFVPLAQCFLDLRSALFIQMGLYKFDNQNRKVGGYSHTETLHLCLAAFKKAINDEVIFQRGIAPRRCPPVTGVSQSLIQASKMAMLGR
ncbi:hypothetical protein E4T56_gene11115 [Termitomyces sp. T112]|nr:hypothetical protein E4T56_gene11115 [Termitomyces sp. T112]